jgi:uncharacterized protein (DUF433 family)
MFEWQPKAYRNVHCIVADPDLLGGKLAVRGTRISISLILECLANGMTLEDINEAYNQVLFRDALSEVLEVASETAVCTVRTFFRPSAERGSRCQQPDATASSIPRLRCSVKMDAT